MRLFPGTYEMAPYLKYLKFIIFIKICNIWIPENGKKCSYVHKYLSVGNVTTTSIFSVNFKINAKYLLRYAIKDVQL